MKAKFQVVACLLLLSASLTGCGPGSTDVSTQVAVPASDILKASLKHPAESGQLGSELITIEDAVGKLKAENAANATVLEKDLAELKAANGPAKVKAKAKDMLNKL